MKREPLRDRLASTAPRREGKRDGALALVETPGKRAKGESGCDKVIFWLLICLVRTGGEPKPGKPGKEA